MSSPNPSTVWNAVNKLTGGKLKGPPPFIVSQGSVITSPPKMVETMNQFYIQKVRKIRQNIPNNGVDPTELFKKMVAGKNLSNKLSIIPPSRHKFSQMLKSMRPTKSYGIDGISMKTIKDYQSYLEPALYNITRQSIIKKIFPSCLKYSKIIPIQKSQTPLGECNSYRPINLLPGLSKVIEKAVFSQIIDHLSKNDIIPHNHHGAKKHHSPITALISIHEMLLEKAEQGDVAALIAIDQSAAFDLCSHDILEEKVKLIGMDQESLGWMTSYLSNRCQQVEIEGFLSPPLYHPPCSIIQGSIGSSVLHQIYTADLPLALHPDCLPHSPTEEKDCQEGSATSFIDDTSLILSAPSVEETRTLVQSALDRIISYLTSNRLQANPKKTKIITVNKHNNKKNVSIEAGGKTIDSCSNFRLLGMQVNNMLTWSNFTSILYGQLSQRLTALRTLSKYASFKVMKNVSTAIIKGKLMFGIEIYAGSPLYIQQRFQHILLSAARISIGRFSYRMSTNNLLQTMGWSGFTQSANIQSAKLVHQIVNIGLPKLLNATINKPLPLSTRGASEGKLRLPVWKQTQSRLGFHFRSVSQYNCIPRNTKEINNKLKFKKKLTIFVQRNFPYKIYDPLKTLPSNDDSDFPDDAQLESGGS